MKTFNKILFTAFSIGLLLCGNICTMDQQTSSSPLSSLTNMSKQTVAFAQRAKHTADEQTELDRNYMLCCINDMKNIPKHLAAGANPNAINIDGKTALHYPQILNNTHIMEQLVAYGANLNSVDNNGFTPLHYAVIDNNEKATHFLLQHAADPNACGINTHTKTQALPPFDYANKSKKIVSALYRAGAQSLSKDDSQKMEAAHKTLERRLSPQIHSTYTSVLAALNTVIQPQDLNFIVIQYMALPASFKEYLEQEKEAQQASLLQRTHTNCTMQLTQPESHAAYIQRALNDGFFGVKTVPSSRPSSRTISRHASPSTSRPTSPSAHSPSAYSASSSRTLVRHDLYEKKASATTSPARLHARATQEQSTTQQQTYRRDEDNPSSLKYQAPHNKKK